MSTDESYAALQLAIGTLSDSELIVFGISCLQLKHQMSAAVADQPEQAQLLGRVSLIYNALAALVLVEVEQQRGRSWDNDLRRLLDEDGDR